MFLCSLRIINVLFTARKRTLYNSQTYSLQFANLYFTQTKRFDSSNQISRIYVVTIFTHQKNRFVIVHLEIYHYICKQKHLSQ